MSRSLVFILCGILLSVFCRAQEYEYAICNDRFNILNVGLANPITIAVNGIPCKDVAVDVHDDNCIVKTRSNPCQYYLYPNNVGKLIVSLYKKESGNLIGESEYRVKYFMPNACIAGRKFGKIEMKAIPWAVRLEVRYEMDWDPGFRDFQYTISMHRNDSLIFKRELEQEEFEEDVLHAFSLLQVGDVVKVNDISFIWPDGRRHSIDPVEYKIVEELNLR